MFYYFLLSLRDLIAIQNVFIFYCIKCRLTKFIELLKDHNVDIISFHRLYKILYNTALKLKEAYDRVVS